jgi:outer membrane protein assembly factor BamE (lipoprotein component of BamABCDE complex)
MRTISMILAAVAALPIALAGCDRYVSETKHTETDPQGNVKEETKTVRQDSNGNVTIDKEKTDQRVIDR